MWKFYDKHVRLGDAKQSELRDLRNKNLVRVETGLSNMGENLPVDTIGQGSYSMRTMVQQPNNDYDIDHAIVFDIADVSDDPCKARKLIRDALCASGEAHLFNQEPQVRTNAVTVYYQSGYHFDLPVYRIYLDEWTGEEVIEHAGTEWRKRNPRAMNDWFKKQVKEKSPKKDEGATVKEGQLRRIVQLVKMFAKSRPDYINIAGGLIITVLVNDCYVPHYDRDDVALFETLQKIHTRTQHDTEVMNPVDFGEKITDKKERYNQVRNFSNEIEKAIGWLTPLFDPNCDEHTAYKAWNKLFKHEYWEVLVEVTEFNQSDTKNATSLGGITTTKTSGSSIKIKEQSFFGD